MPLGRERVEDACRAWVWVPDSATTLETDDYLLVRYPDWFFHPLELARLAPGSPGRAVAEVLDEALARARELGSPTIWCWVKLDAPAGLGDLLVERGGEPEETLDVFARDLGRAGPDLDPAEVELRWVDDVAALQAFDEVSTTVFGGGPRPAEEAVVEAERLRADLAAGLGGTLVASLDGRPVGVGGLSLVDGVARLWGGGVVADARGRGIYRALLAARTSYAVERGAGLALVKGRVETSGPILRRAGFEVFGQERSFRLAL